MPDAASRSLTIAATRRLNVGCSRERARASREASSQPKDASCLTISRVTLVHAPNEVALHPCAGIRPGWDLSNGGSPAWCNGLLSAQLASEQWSVPPYITTPRMRVRRYSGLPCVAVGGPNPGSSRTERAGGKGAGHQQY
jgi:hypothetical protein